MIEKAIRIALQSPHPSHRHATLVFRGGALLASGFNHHERCSEYVALSKLWPSKRRGTTVLNIRITRGGTMGLAKPCPDCWSYLLANGVKKAVWFDGVQFVEERLR
jgi:hypothetical protein